MNYTLFLKIQILNSNLLIKKFTSNRKAANVVRSTLPSQSMITATSSSISIIFSLSLLVWWQIYKCYHCRQHILPVSAELDWQNYWILLLFLSLQHTGKMSYLLALKISNIVWTNAFMSHMSSWTTSWTVFLCLAVHASPSTTVWN